MSERSDGKEKGEWKNGYQRCCESGYFGLEHDCRKQPAPSAVEAKGKSKLTKWEAGNELVALADACSTAIHELKDWPELRVVAIRSREAIVIKYIEQGFIDEMGFGI